MYLQFFYLFFLSCKFIYIEEAFDRIFPLQKNYKH